MNEEGTNPQRQKPVMTGTHQFPYLLSADHACESPHRTTHSHLANAESDTVPADWVMMGRVNYSCCRPNDRAEPRARRDK